MSDYIIVFLISIPIGFINTLAGSGSLVMLPLLMGMGLPAPVANGTNRVAVLFQSGVGVFTFLGSKRMSFDGTGWSIIPCVLGALVGAWVATQVSANQLKEIIGILLIVMLGVILARPKRWLQKADQVSEKKYRSPAAILSMFAIGFYGGFIQAGVGVFLLAGLVLGVGYGLERANFIKLLIVAAYALPVLLVFIVYQQVDWGLGLLTAVGQSIGAFIGANFATRYHRADVWIYRLLVLVVFGAIIHFYKLWSWFM